MTIPKISLTHSKLASVCAWTFILLMQALARFRPVKALPAPLRTLIIAALLLAAAIVIISALGLRTEKPDERAILNSCRANSALFECLFLLFAVYQLFGERFGWSAILVTRSEALLAFALLNLLRDGFFLLYERFAG